MGLVKKDGSRLHLPMAISVQPTQCAPLPRLDCLQPSLPSPAQ